MTSKSGKFQWFVEDNFLTQVLSESARKDALLDLLFVTKEGLKGDVTVGDCLGHNDHRMVVFVIVTVSRFGTT